MVTDDGVMRHRSCALGGVQLRFGSAVNIALRLAMLAMVAEVLRAGQDEGNLAPPRSDTEYNLGPYGPIA